MTIKRNAMGSGVSAGAASSTIGSLTNNIAAAGGSQAAATALSLTSNNVVTSGTGGVLLPPGIGAGDQLAPGDWVRVFNKSGASVNVYPPLGGSIQGGSANAAFALANNKPAEFVCIDGLNFFANLSA